MAKANKKLTAEFLKKKQKELMTREKHTIQIGEDSYLIEIDKFFTNSKVAELSSDIAQFAVNVFSDEKYNDLNPTRLSLLSEKYIFAMLINHFTDLEIPTEIEDAILSIDVLHDMGLLEKITGLMDEEELSKTMEHINERLSYATSELHKRLEDIGGKLDKEMAQEEAVEEELIEENTEEAK